MYSLKVKSILIFFFCIVVCCLNYINSTLMNIGVIDSRYDERYLSSERYGSNIPISLFAVSVLNLIIFKQITKCNNSTMKVFFEYILIISFLCCFLGSVSTFLIRVGSYFQICTIFIFSVMYKECKGRYDIKLLGFHLAFFVAYWFLTVVVANLGETFPYKSLILGI